MLLKHYLITEMKNKIQQAKADVMHSKNCKTFFK